MQKYVTLTHISRFNYFELRPSSYLINNKLQYHVNLYIDASMSNFAIFGFYLENCKRQVFNVNCEIDQHDKFYLPADVQQNRTTGVGVMAPEMSVFTYSCIFGYYLEIYRRQKVNLNCKFEQHDKVYLPGIGLQVLE